MAGTLTGQFSFDGALRHFPARCPLPASATWGVAYAAPVVSIASANSAPSGGGGTVTISGLSFGAAGPTATASLTAADACGSSAWTSATTVVCTPQAYGGSAAVRTAVSVSGVAGTLTGQFSFDGTNTGSGKLPSANCSARPPVSFSPCSVC